MITRHGEIYSFETFLPDGTPMLNRFNYALYRKYRETKDKTSGLFKDHRIKDHPMIGRAFLRPDGIIGIIEIVSKHWWFGYYEHVVYRIHNTRSHGTGIYRNFSSVCSSISEMAEDFSKYTLLEPEDVPEEFLKDALKDSQ